ncbi:MAG: metallophosphoesterase [Armatimonadetes bacterium]|nr:metallophosphoesterase [Armatimonadota bacterium]
MCKTISRLLCTAVLIALLSASASAERFRVIALPDTQNYSEFHPGIFIEQTNWVKSNVASLNIAFVTHLGDVVNEGWKDAQWANALTAMNVLKGQVPFGLCPGNHDLRSVDPDTYDSTKFVTNFGASYFAGYSWYRGASPSGFSSYQIVTAGGYDLLFLHMTCDSPDSEITWAKSVLSEHSGTPTIVTTHEYLTSSQRDRFNTIPGRNSGESVWNKLIRQYDQIFAVLCGHVFSPDGWHRQISANNAGRKVYEMMSDYQDIGNGWLRILLFDTATGDLSVTTYSTHLDSYMNDSGNKFTYNVGIGERFSPGITARSLKPKVTSKFASGLDGWTKIGDADSTLVRKSDADGSGYLLYTDGASGTADYFVAPSKFRGNLSAYDAITFDCRSFSGDDPDPTHIRLYSGSQYYQWANTERVTDNGQWEQLTASLRDADLWTAGGGATEAFASFITHITAVHLCADVCSGTEKMGLDNFSLAEYETLDGAPAVSTFDSGRDGWTVDADGDAGWDNHGFVSGTDLSTGGTWYFCAPAEFLGDKLLCYRGTLQFDLKQEKVDNPFDREEVVLAGAGLTLVMDYASASHPNAAWTHYTLPLNEYAGWVKASTGLAPTSGEFMAVLSSLTSLRIRGEYRSGADKAWLDNVAMTLAEAVPVGSLAETGGLPDGTTISIGNAAVASAASTTFSNGSYYIEERDRSSGIKVLPEPGLGTVAEGDMVTGAGMLRTDANGERYISLTSVSANPGSPVRPLLLTNKSLTDGVNSIGLLVTLYGKIVYTDPAPNGPRYLYIDDGSRVALESQTGVRVVLDGLTAPITRGLGCEALFVTGLISLAQGEYGTVPVIRPRSNDDIVTVGDRLPPSAPSDLSCTVISAAQVNLTWIGSSDNVGVAGYRIYRNGIQIGTTSETSFADTTCQADAIYLYQVTAYDTEGNESVSSNSVGIAVPPHLEITLDNPSAEFTGTWQLGTTASGKYGADYRWAYSAATQTATATWRPTISIAGYYRVYVWYSQGTNRSIKAPYTITYEGGQQTVLVNQQAGGGQWVEIGTKRFAAGTAGCVTLGNGTAEASNIVVIADAVRFVLVSMDLTRPTIPTGFTATASGPTTIYLSWTAATDNIGVAGYKIYRGGTYTGYSTATNFTDTGLTPNTTYSYQVSAYDAAGNESVRSATRTATTPAN